MVPLIARTEEFPAFSPTLSPFSQLEKPILTTAEKIHSIAISLKIGAYTTLKTIPESFLQVVFDYSDNCSPIPYDILSVCCKTIYWASVCLPYNFAMNCYNAFVPPPKTFESFPSPHINTDHIQVTDTSIKMDGIPNDIQIETLNDLFLKINFENPNDLTYIVLPKEKTPKQLQENLEKLVNHIKKREPLAGTPRADNPIELNLFYQQIENAIKSCIHQINQAIKTFEDTHNLQALTIEESKQYKDLWENRSQLIVDLAIAGEGCGAQYRGDVMEIYSHHFHKPEMSASTLANNFINILAQERLKIAREQIQKLADTSSLHQIIKIINSIFQILRLKTRIPYNLLSAHQYTQYMGYVGSKLKLPGFEHNIIDPTVDPPNIALHLEEFFAIYTEGYIQQTIQENIKKHLSLREQILDWLKIKRDNWCDFTREIRERDLNFKIKKIIEEQNQEEIEPSRIAQLNFLIELLDREKPSLPSPLEWGNMIETLFQLPQVKNAFFQIYPNLTLVEKHQKYNQMQQRLSREIISKSLAQAYINKQLSIENIKPILQTVQAALKIQRIIALPLETCLKMVKLEINIPEHIHSAVEREMDDVFIDKLNLTRMQEEGLSSEILEWILVEHKILYPSLLRPLLPLDKPQLNLQETTTLIAKADNAAEQLGVLEEFRACFHSKNVDLAHHVNATIDRIFERNSIEKIISILNAAAPNQQFLPSWWETVVWIKGPSIIKTIVDWRLVRFVLGWTALVYTMKGLEKIETIAKPLAERITVYAILNKQAFPRFLLRLIETMNRLHFLIYPLFVTDLLIHLLATRGFIPFPHNLIRHLDRIRSFWGFTPFHVIQLRDPFLAFSSVYSLAGLISAQCEHVSTQANAERAQKVRELVFKLIGHAVTQYAEMNLALESEAIS